MTVKSKIKHITVELKGHAPFTFFGAVTGLLFMFIFKDLSRPHTETLFRIFHPSHVLLSAVVTASLFALHQKKRNWLMILAVGYFGSVGVATLSDSIIPFFGESILGVTVPSHDTIHNNDGISGDHNNIEQNHRHIAHRLYLGFIEDWRIVNPAAILGILIAYVVPRTKFPHSAHILISTWASASHVLMNINSNITFTVAIAILIILFIAVWLPCCFSDIVFPLLFVKSDLELAGLCQYHKRHSHKHLHENMEDVK